MKQCLLFRNENRDQTYNKSRKRSNQLKTEFKNIQTILFINNFFFTI